MFNLGLRSYRGRGRERLVEVFVVGYDKENSGLGGERIASRVGVKICQAALKQTKQVH